MAQLQPLPPGKHGLWSPAHPARGLDFCSVTLGRPLSPEPTWASPAWLCLTPLSLLEQGHLPGKRLPYYFQGSYRPTVQKPELPQTLFHPLCAASSLGTSVFSFIQ